MAEETVWTTIYTLVGTIAFIGCLGIWIVCEELISRREWGSWPWKTPLYRKSAEIQAKQTQKDINMLATQAQLEIDELKYKFPDFK
tara:strand:+ start:50 stop:307 length:258 start_codon:yes stop_codon:yes gene_type:complete